MQLMMWYNSYKKGAWTLRVAQRYSVKRSCTYGASTSKTSAAFSNQPFTEGSNDTPDMIMKISSQGCGCYCPRGRGEKKKILHHRALFK